MRVIRPHPIGSGNLTSTNVPATYPSWDAGTTYSAGDIVEDSDYEFESLQDSNTGNVPVTAGSEWWLNIGRNNRGRMFDRANSTLTTNADSIEVVFDITGRADSISLINMQASTVRIVMETTADGTIYDQTFSLNSDGDVSNWWEYYFEPVTLKNDLTIHGLPLNLDPTFSVYINRPGETASIGTLAVGQSFYLGKAMHPANAGIMDFSRMEVDEFGEWSLTKRNFSDRLSLKLHVDQYRITAIRRELADLRAEPVIWIGQEDWAWTWIFGFYKDFRFDSVAPNEAYLYLDLEGLSDANPYD